jgi:O-antigen ligase
VWLVLVALLLAGSLLANLIGASRGPLMSMALLFVLGAGVVWLRLGPRWGITLFAAGIAAFLVVASFVFQRDPEAFLLVQDYLFGDWTRDWTASNAGIPPGAVRLSMLLVPEAPFFGHGLASWAEALRHPVLGLQPDAFILGFAHPHNEYLNLLVKVGIVGTALFFAPMLIALAGAGRLAAQRGRRIHAVVIAWFVGAHLWWSQAESNRRPLECHSSALPTELWPL